MEPRSEPVNEDRNEPTKRLCCQCDGLIEASLVAVKPAASICLECMSREELSILEDDLNEAREVDRSLLPGTPRLVGWELESHDRPSRVLSGDFHDLRTGREPHLLSLVVGDVSGKGFPAALLRTSLLGAVRALVPEFPSAAAVLERANTQFLLSATRRHFASLFLGSLDLRNGELRYANAGHLPPMVWRCAGKWEELAPTGVALGMLREPHFIETAVRLAAGDLLVVYSDGVTEAEGREPGSFFGRERLRAAVEARAGAPLREILEGVIDTLRHFSPGEPRDDRTLVLLRRLPGAA